MTTGGETRVRMRRQSTKMPTMMPRRLIRSMSVILIAFADRTRKITDILSGRINMTAVTGGSRLLLVEYSVLVAHVSIPIFVQLLSMSRIFPDIILSMSNL